MKRVFLKTDGTFPSMYCPAYMHEGSPHVILDHVLDHRVYFQYEVEYDGIIIQGAGFHGDVVKLCIHSRPISVVQGSIRLPLESNGIVVADNTGPYTWRTRPAPGPLLVKLPGLAQVFCRYPLTKGNLVIFNPNTFTLEIYR